VGPTKSALGESVSGGPGCRRQASLGTVSLPAKQRIEISFVDGHLLGIGHGDEDNLPPTLVALLMSSRMAVVNGSKKAGWAASPCGASGAGAKRADLASAAAARRG
jgi:hypothetical protein